MRPIPDKAEVAIDFPEKTYIGSFQRSARYEAHADERGMTIKLERRDDQKRMIEIHLHHDLFADILADLAESVRKLPPIDERHRLALAEAALKLHAALSETK